MSSFTITIFFILFVGGVFFVGFSMGLYLNIKPKKSIKRKYIERLEEENRNLKLQCRMFMRHDD